jgi:GcrA cell cycle regulator
MTKSDKDCVLIKGVEPTGSAPESSLVWTPERIQQLTDLWIAGTTSSQIAKLMGLSRGAVMGKVRRLGLIGKGPQQRKPGLIKTPVQEPNHGPKTIFSLGHNECRWPLEMDQSKKSEFFCGEPVLHPRYSFCEEHCKRAFTILPKYKKSEYVPNLKRMP